MSQTQVQTFNSFESLEALKNLLPDGDNAMTTEDIKTSETPIIVPAAQTQTEAPRSTMMSRISNIGDVTQHTINRITREVENNLESYLRRCDENKKQRDERVSYSFALNAKQVPVAKQICDGLRDQGARVTLRRFSDLEREGRNALRTHVVVTINVPKVK